MIEQFAKDVWVAQMPLRFYGVQTGTRMTIIRLQNGKLFVHSPIEFSKKLKKEVDALGEAAYLISPIKIHNLFLGSWQKAYPKAKMYASPGLVEHRKDLKFDANLQDTPEAVWSKEIDQTIFRGSTLMQEVVFYHKPSKTLIMTDFIQRYDEDKPLYTRIFSWIDGMYKRYGVARDLKFTMRKSKEQVWESVTRILDWDFDKMIIAHGRLVRENAKEIFRECFEFAKPRD